MTTVADDVFVPIPPVSNAIPLSIAADSQGPPLETSRQCPLCSAEVRFFFINFNDKMLMCENTTCEFPFGHEDLTFIKENEALAPDEELECLINKSNNKMSLSCITGGTWAVVDRLKVVEDSQHFESKALDPMEFINTSGPVPKEKGPTAVELKLQEIKRLAKEQQDIQRLDSDDYLIKDQKILKKLQNLQELKTSIKLTQEEINLIENEQEKVDPNVQIKIHKNSGESIKIDFTINATQIPETQKV